MTNKKETIIISNACGVMAQLVERLVRNEEASGSNPLSSTKRNLNRTTYVRVWFLFFYAKTAERLVFLQARRSAILNNFVNLLD